HPDVFAEVLRQGTELLHHPQLVHDQQVVEVDDPKFGKVRQLGALVKMTATPACTDRAAPALNEDEDELRRREPGTQQSSSGSAPGTPPLAGVTVVELG